MTGPGQLPPDKVAEIDQRIALYGTNLDTMVGLYRALVGQFGTAGAQVAISKSFTRQTDPKAQAAFRNLLIAAIARLADHAEFTDQVIAPSPRPPDDGERRPTTE